MSALKFLFSTRGRVTRLPFILFVVGLHALIVIATYFARHQDPLTNILQYTRMFTIIGMVGLITLWPVFAVTVKRLHDINWSFAPALGLFVPPMVAYVSSFTFAYLYGTDPEGLTSMNQASNWVIIVFNYYIYALLLVLSLVKGTKGTNRFGPDSLSKTAAASTA